MKFLNKINVLKIITEHFETFYNNKTKKRDNIEITIYLLIPIIVSIFLALKMTNAEINNSINQSILTFLSIFTPSMFGMLAVIYSFISEELTVEGYKFLKEFKSNIMFIILISIATLVFSLIFTFNLSMNENYITLLQTLIYFGTFLIIITSLMALKRFNKLINSIINKNIKIKELENI